MNAPLKPQTRFLLEDTGGVGYFFDAPSSYWEARNVDEVSGALRQIEEACRQGQHVLGLFPYELGLALQDLPTRHPSDGVLLRAWAFPRLRTWSSKDIETFLTEATSNEPPSGFAGLQPQIDVMTYGQTVNQIHQAIREGETYQLNFTFPWRGSLYGSPLSVYRRLRERQPGPYSAYLEWESGWVLSHSPESFIEHQAGMLTCRPMKGTSDRDGGSELSRDPKNQSENVMIVDHRTYELQPGRLREFLALYEKEGLPVQMKHLGNLVGYFTTEVGNVNEIVHIWGYADLADRTKRRAAMAADPAWQAYLQKSREYMKHMNNKILVPTAFSPTK